MSDRIFHILLFLGVIFVIILSVFLFDSIRVEYVFPSTTLNGEPVGRQSREKIRQHLDGIERKIFEQPIILEIGSKSFETTLDEMGFVFDKETVEEYIFRVGHDMVFLERLKTWLGSWVGIKTEINYDEEIFRLNPELLSIFVEESDIHKEALSAPSNGELRIEGNGVFAEPPHDGYGINTGDMRIKALELLVHQPKSPWYITVDTTTLSPDVSLESFSGYRRSLISYLSEGLRLEFQGEEVSAWSAEELFKMLEIRQEGTGWFLRIPEEKQDVFFKDLLARDAEFVVEDNYTVSIQPSQEGFVFDKENLVATFHYAFDTNDHVLNLSTRERTDPKNTTEDLEAMEVSHVIAQFTTYYECCQNRVKNIHRIADIVDGAIIMPEESFELNEYVGERTVKKGFVPAGALFFGEHVDNVGGGVSQFATTLYNAAYWSGLWIENHKPHSQYFSRYPEGIEATVSWKYPTLRFTNDYTTPIVIKTKHTNTSVTVMILGNNDGRILVGDHKSASTNMQTLAEGGKMSRRITSTVSPRYNIKPTSIRYIAYPNRYLPGEQETTEVGKDGWTVDVARTVTYPNIEFEHTQSWKTTYIHPTIIQVHSCAEVLDSTASCFNAS